MDSHHIRIPTKKEASQTGGFFSLPANQAAAYCIVTPP